MSYKKFNFNHLILLIGTNPLPNFVVADYFLKHNEKIEKIWLVHSEKNNFQAGTDIQARNLENLLKKRWQEEKKHHSLKFPLEKISLSDVSDASQIKHDIPDNMREQLKNAPGSHLNYTGGTKSMSTHLYHILKGIENNKEKSFSYLDARNFRLIDDESGLISEDLRDEVVISFEELIDLHGFKRKNKDSEFEFSDALDAFKELINNNKLNTFYDKSAGYNRKLFENRRGNLSEKTSELNKEKIDNFKPNDAFNSVLLNMPKEYRLFSEDGKFNWDISNKKLKNAIGFIDGKWFESYAKKILKETFKEKLSILINWEIKKTDWSARVCFELDVILIRGYQLTGISCTTSFIKSLCKSKGFEILHRTRQIGGDEAKAVLLTRLENDKKRDLQEELIYDTGGDKNILVLGMDDLKEEKLVSEIKEFIFGKE